MGRLFSKRCIITGAGSGIGRAGAIAFAREGAVVAVLDLSEKNAKAVANEIQEFGGKAIGVSCDVSDEGALQRAIDQAAEFMGGVDVCWANAGTGDGGTVLTTPLDHFEMIMRINLTGMFLTAKYTIPYMEQAGKGSLIFTSSSGVLSQTPGVVSNMAAKGGVLGLTRQISTDFLAKKIRVNAVCPGPIRTHAMLSSMEALDKEHGLSTGSLLKEFEETHPLGRIGEPEEVANVALFLASDDASWVNAQFINVSGTGH